MNLNKSCIEILYAGEIILGKIQMNLNKSCIEIKDLNENFLAAIR